MNELSNCDSGTRRIASKKRHPLALAAAILALAGIPAMVGCDNTRERNAGVQENAESAAQEAKDAAGAAMDTTRDEMEEMKTNLKERLDRLDEELAVLKAKAEAAGAEAKVQLLEAYNETRGEREAFSKKMGELKDASAEAWREASTTLKEGVEKLEARVDELVDSASK